jgi:universal stress protein E
MRPIKTILVAIKDPTTKTSAAASKAAQLAKGLKARLILFHDIATPMYAEAIYARQVDLKSLQRETQAMRREQLEKIAQRLRQHAIEVEVAAEWDFPVYEAVIRMANRVGADLVVAENHASGTHRARWLLAYTDWELLRLCPVPVLLVKSRALYHHPRIMASVDPLHAYAKPANLDRQILRAGAQIAAALHGELHGLHAYMPPMPIVPTFASGPIMDMGTQRDETERDARERMNRELDGYEIRRGNRHLVEGRPVEVIPSVTKSSRTNILVMGAVSRSGLKRFFIGNTAESVIDSVSCDVLIVKPQRFESKVPRTSRGVQILATPIMPG